MSLSWTVQRVLSVEVTDDLHAQPGVVAQSDMTFLFGLVTDFNTPQSWWYRTTDEGLTWTRRTNTIGGAHNFPSHASNRPSNELYLLGTTEEAENVSVVRTLDGCNTWSTRKTWQRGAGASAPGVWGHGLVLDERFTLVACGQFETSGGSPRLAFARSEDGGATWSEYGDVLHPAGNSKATAICNASKGLFFAGGVLMPSFNYYPYLWKSTDHALTWELSGPLPMPANTIYAQINAITAVTSSVIIAAGTGVVSPGNGASFTWRSTDAGASWDRIHEADIANWQSSETAVWPQEVYRITRDAVILGIYNTPTGTNPPWVLSLDQGATFPLAPTVIGNSIPPNSVSIGSLVVTKHGNILLPLHSDQGDTNVREVWLGRIVSD